uniref:Uncharacterized protein n=1 Tax=Nyssomyia neivai TaxID=330878 RepID=A0A1L8D8W4_9DIPT
MGIVTCGRPGRLSSSVGMACAGIVSGNTTTNCTMRRPFSKGFLYCGIPSPRIHLSDSCLIISPGRDVITKSLSSSVLTTFWKPQSASTSCKCIVIMRSSRERLNVGCSFSSNTITMSPGCRSGS